MIKVKNLVKYYKDNNCQALKGITFSVKESEIFGFLGPNGAGKTTTIKILTGQIKPTSGEARVADFDAASESEKIKEQVGVVFEEQNLYEDLSVELNLKFFAKLYGVDFARIKPLLNLVGLDKKQKYLVKTLSRGQKQRLAIARALISNPMILFLDEPTVGLDPQTARHIREIIKKLSQIGKTIFLTTHYMEEADFLCDKIAIIDDGKIIALDSPEKLKESLSSEMIKVKYIKDNLYQDIDLSLEDKSAREKLMQILNTHKIVSLFTSTPTLEDVFIHLTGANKKLDSEE